MTAQRLRITVDVFGDPDLYDSDLPANSGFISVSELTNEIEAIIDRYPNIERQSDCLFQRLDPAAKEKAR